MPIFEGKKNERDHQNNFGNLSAIEVNKCREGILSLGTSRVLLCHPEQIHISVVALLSFSVEQGGLQTIHTVWHPRSESPHCLLNNLIDYIVIWFCEEALQQESKDLMPVIHSSKEDL